MFRRWKENGRKALLAMQAAVLSRMMTICSYAETVQDANWMKEDPEYLLLCLLCVRGITK